jgi:hypothetical protein
MRKVLKRLRKKHGKLSKSVQQRLNQEKDGHHDDDDDDIASITKKLENVLESDQDDSLGETDRISENNATPFHHNDATPSPGSLEDTGSGPLTTRNVVGYRSKHASSAASVDSDNLQDENISSAFVTTAARSLFLRGGHQDARVYQSRRCHVATIDSETRWGLRNV